MISTEIISFIQHTQVLCILEIQYILLFFFFLIYTCEVCVYVSVYLSMYFRKHTCTRIHEQLDPLTHTFIHNDIHTAPQR